MNGALSKLVNLFRNSVPVNLGDCRRGTVRPPLLKTALSFLGCCLAIAVLVLIGYTGCEEYPLVDGGYGGHGPAIWPADDGKTKLVDPTFQDATIIDGEVLLDGLPANEKVVLW